MIPNKQLAKVGKPEISIYHESLSRERNLLPKFSSSFLLFLLILLCSCLYCFEIHYFLSYVKTFYYDLLMKYTEQQPQESFKKKKKMRPTLISPSQSKWQWCTSEKSQHTPTLFCTHNFVHTTTKSRFKMGLLIPTTSPLTPH